ncbi:MobA/MobL family protein [Clostridium butyricum]|uniref:MobA/MobL protein domain-containing protein n=1 Tax=Clostridium butyricum TaxID=1492 RepID=A0A2S7FBT3_CLOBU|nr:MobA/MobL family protein [Clostridium butyricum]KHD14014.1 hypothetical protein OA81_17390 [Clostridium butyricum]PPV15389.1 hypothetical protein AWN73_12140 [Clostridium butyricum]
MATKELSTKVAIVGRGTKCKGGKSAVEQSSYISRTTLYSDYYGENFYPKYSEDLVHTEIMLPENAPEKYMDRSILWNSAEEAERKSPKAQIARSYKVSLPNDWSYDLATEVMRDYVKRNFVDDGMCAEFAIHDSENPQHQRNLHCHILLTMRPILEDGSWGDKQKKVYFYDEQGNKIRKKNGQYKCTTQDVTGWNSQDNAKKWRKDLADTINAVNEKLGKTEDFWEHRSFAERGLDRLPTIHLGEKASAMERAGIHTERGNVNRQIMQHNLLLEQAKVLYDEAVAKLEQLKESKPVVAVVNEVLELIQKVIGKKGRLDLPIMKGKYLSKIPDRSRLQSEEQAVRFVTASEISTFGELKAFSQEKEQEFQTVSNARQAIREELATITELQELYAEYVPYREIKDSGKGLKGFAKIRYDKEHKDDYEEYSRTREALYAKLGEGKKLTPKAWQTKVDELNQTLAKSKPEYGKLVTQLAYAEVITHNKANYEREQANEQRKPTRTKRKEQEI